MEKENIKFLRERVNASVKVYETALNDKDSMYNDLLDYAEVAILHQRRLIIALQNELRRVVEDEKNIMIYINQD